MLTWGFRTSIHWHGIRQLNNAVHDGANGITECPIPPNSSRVYNFLAEQYGTSWYHSHFSAQYGYGTVGSLVINGPTSLPYDEDLGVFPVTDWYYRSADEILEQVHHGGPPPSDNILINGTNVNVAGTSGAYAVTELTPGKRYKLRIINPSVDNVFTVRLQNHSMTVVASDFVPVNSVTVNELFLGIGQRYDVTIDASQPIGNYWFNVSLSSTNACGTSLNKFPASIFRYKGAPVQNPTNKGTPIPELLCVDNLDMQPVVQRTAPANTFSKSIGNTLPVALATETVNGTTNVFWKVNGSSIDIQWEKPTLQYVMEGNSSFPPNLNLIKVPQANQWAYWVIENQSVLPHPIHLHGHDFLVLGRSNPPASPFTSTPVPFNPATDVSKLKFNNPTRRDVTQLPANGWLVIAFRTDNPGAWLMHCHIAWHVSFGLSVQFLERVQDIPSTVDLPNIVQNCNNWRNYYATSPFKKHDSGL